MKTKKLEKWLLLEQSGELSPRQLRLLGRELDISVSARRLREELRILCGSVKKTDVEPSPWVVARIAVRLRDEGRSVIGFSKILKPAFAVAASLMVVAGVLNFHGEQTCSTSTAVVAAAGVDVWDDPFEQDLSKLENLIVSISGNPIDIMEM
ncbi:MAG: hypothetical protein WC334_09955 [Kiritimatiellales bacterium]|jgi:hypothetical protein